LILFAFESESEQKYENKCKISDIRPYPIYFHPYILLTARFPPPCCTVYLLKSQPLQPACNELQFHAPYSPCDSRLCGVVGLVTPQVLITN
jgi:hypothetical protein